MDHNSFILAHGVMYFAAAVIAVLLSQSLGIGAVAGYLLAGIAIGPWGFNLVGGVEDIHFFAELGVVFLMFLIGLELEPRRLWNMRGRLLALGLSQVAGTVAVFATIAALAGYPWQVGAVAGMALSLSSTAIALQPLTERGGLSTQVGQATFAVLLFQDIAVIPMLALVPLLTSGDGGSAFSWSGLGFSAAVIAATLIGGHYLARPVFRHIARTRLREIFTAFALLIVLGIAWGFQAAGLSMALGTFLAGVLLAESEYRHEIEAAVEPFKGLLLGLFFISVGMSTQFGLLTARPFLVLGLVAGLFLLKGIVLWLIGRATKLPRDQRGLFIVLLAQGGEFAFVVLGVAQAKGSLEPEISQALVLAVALSMLLTPLLLVMYDKYYVSREEKANAEPDTPEAGRILIAGLGRVGQVVARLLHASGFEPVVLDDDPDGVQQLRQFGFRVFYGDATRLDLLHAAGADQAKFLIIALNDPAATTRLAEIARKHFPHLRVFARARDMRHMFELRDVGVDVIERDTFRAALALGELALAEVCGDAGRAARAARTFAEHDEVVVEKLYEVHRVAPDQHVSVSNELRDQLSRTLSEDRAADARDETLA